MTHNFNGGASIPQIILSGMDGNQKKKIEKCLDSLSNYENSNSGVIIVNNIIKKNFKKNKLNRVYGLDEILYQNLLFILFLTFTYPDLLKKINIYPKIKTKHRINNNINTNININKNLNTNINTNENINYELNLNGNKYDLGYGNFPNENRGLKNVMKGGQTNNNKNTNNKNMNQNETYQRTIMNLKNKYYEEFIHFICYYQEYIDNIFNFLKDYKTGGDKKTLKCIIEKDIEQKSNKSIEELFKTVEKFNIDDNNLTFQDKFLYVIMIGDIFSRILPTILINERNGKYKTELKNEPVFKPLLENKHGKNNDKVNILRMVVLQYEHFVKALTLSKPVRKVYDEFNINIFGDNKKPINSLTNSLKYTYYFPYLVHKVESPGKDTDIFEIMKRKSKTGYLLTEVSKLPTQQKNTLMNTFGDIFKAKEYLWSSLDGMLIFLVTGKDTLTFKSIGQLSKTGDKIKYSNIGKSVFTVNKPNVTKNVILVKSVNNINKGKNNKIEIENMEIRIELEDKNLLIYLNDVLTYQYIYNMKVKRYQMYKLCDPIKKRLNSNYSSEKQILEMKQHTPLELIINMVLGVCTIKYKNMFKKVGETFTNNKC